jgi:HTH-type transcriptional regulator/antitoxin HipB
MQTPDTKGGNSQHAPHDPPAATPHSDQPFRLYTAASVGPAIRRYREEAGLTQAQLAEMAGLNRTYLSDLEQGKETEQVRRILRVLKLLGVRATLQRAEW